MEEVPEFLSIWSELVPPRINWTVSFDHETLPLLTPIALLNSNSKQQGYIRGTDLYSQNENVPWKSQRNLFGGEDDDQDETEEIQMRIMEELEDEHYNNSRLIPNSL